MSYHTTSSRQSLFATVLLIFGIVLAGCAVFEATDAPSVTNRDALGEELLAEHNLDGLGATEIVERLDTMEVADRPADLLASVQPDLLVLTDDQGREAHVAMPADEVYVSIAPFQSQTHDCYFHSLTTCLGELSNTAVNLTLTDEATGEVLVDDADTTYSNGFIGLWVPRDIEAKLTIEYDGTSGSETISTVNPDDPTCITTLQLT